MHIPHFATKHLPAALFIAGVLWLLGHSTPAFADSDACRTDVLKFERVIYFVRQSVGNDQAAEIKEKLLPAKLEFEILQKDGYCGLSRYIREKKLDDKKLAR